MHTRAGPATVRPFRADDADYAAVVDVSNRVLPDHPTGVADVRAEDEARPAGYICERFMAEIDGETAGYGQIFQVPGMYHPRKFYIDVRVAPERRGRGVGAQLYEALRERLEAHDALVARAELREDWEASLRFAGRRGFVEEMRGWELRLDVRAFDPAPFAEHEGRVVAQGVEVITLRDLMERDPDHRRTLYDAVANDMARDVPRPDAFTPPDFAAWSGRLFDNKNFYPEAYFIALDGDTIAAVSNLRRSVDPEVLWTGLTATRHAYRRRGLALALKLRAITFAKAQGMREIRTGNASTNQGMLAINEALGFVRQPAWLTMALTLNEE